MELLNITTTIRNPIRLIDFLKTLSHIEGQVWNNETQMLFQSLLIQERIYKPTSNNLSVDQIEVLENPNIKMSLNEAKEIFRSKNYKDPAMRGRTSFSPLKEFGLAFIENDCIKLSKQGEMLLSGEIDFEDTFFQWSLKWQFPNPISSKLRKGTNIRPFVGFLKLIDEVNKECVKRGLKVKGLSKYEFNIFALSLIHHNQINNKVQNILDFRQQIESLNDYSEQKLFYEDQLNYYLSEYNNFSMDNVRDYADNLKRYYLLTGLVRLRGGGFYIDLTQEKNVVIENIFTNIGYKSSVYEKAEDYLNYLGDSSKPELDYSKSQMIYEQKQNLAQLIEETSLSYDIESIQDSKELEYVKKRFLDQVFKKEHSNVQGVLEIIDKITNVRELDLKPSIALEYWVSKGLLVINDALEIKPNYLTDSDNNVIFTAGANVGDIECFYNDFNLLCEVTLLSSRNQWYNEGQPVMRHFKDFLDENGKRSYCLFIAPKIHRDTINTFWTALKYEYEGSTLKIIPITLTDFNKILEVQKDYFANDKNITSEKLDLLFSSLTDVENIDNSDNWRAHIRNTINSFN